MHHIPVRQMKFAVPDAARFDPIYVAGLASMSYNMTGLGLYVALLEPFIVKSMRRVLPNITDAALAEEVDRFCRQEAQHFAQHRAFNEIVFAQDYPGLRERYEALGADFDDMLANRDDRYRIGFVEGFEANTTQGALRLLQSGIFRHPKSDPAFGELWSWHLLEELEHRNVAYDIYEHLYGEWLYRARMCWVAQAHMATFIDDCTRIMSAVDILRHGERCRVRPIERVMGVAMRYAPRLRSMLPGYTPHDYQVPDELAAMSALYSGKAVSVT